MFSLAFSGSITGTKTCTFVSGSRITNDGLLKSLKGKNDIWLKHMKQFRPGNKRRPGIVARIKKGQKHDYPWPEDIDPKLTSGHLSHLSDFKPLTEKPKPITLGFEKPLIDLETKIMDVRKMSEETGLDFTDQIISLEAKYQQALKDLYKNVTPFQRLQIARHPNRPTSLDHILKMTDMWVELHGDRAGYDDPALITGIGRMDGESYVFIAHQKGRNTKENIKRNFGMPTPHGYRKALRMMKYAEHHGLPIITLIDTPGAYPDLKCEQLGQGEAIAFNLRAMFGIKVPILTVVLGEGGSGGALAIGCGNKMLMMENAVFYVASPEACSVILWKTKENAPLAAEKLKITAEDHCEQKICDGIIPEPLGGAHTDPSLSSKYLKIAIKDAMEELTAMDTETLLKHRHDKYRNIGGFTEEEFVEPEFKRNMKKKEFGVLDYATDAAADDAADAAADDATDAAADDATDDDVTDDDATDDDATDDDDDDAADDDATDDDAADDDAADDDAADDDAADDDAADDDAADDDAADDDAADDDATDDDVTEEIENELENFKTALETENDWSGFTMSDKAMKKMLKELDKEMNDAFAAMGLQEKMEALELELSKSDTGDISPGLKEKVDSLAREFNQNLSQSNSSDYNRFMKKVKISNEVYDLKVKMEKSEQLEKEINEKLKGPVLNEKFEILKEARERVAEGEQLDDSKMEKVETAKKDLAEMIKSLDFVTFVGFGKNNIPTCPPNLEGAIGVIDGVANMEVQQAVLSSNMRGKIELLKDMVRNNTANLETARALYKEIGEGISAVMNEPAMKMRIENLLAIEFPPVSEESSVLDR